MSSSHMTSEEMTYVKKLGVYCGVMVYALCPSQFTQVSLAGQDLTSYQDNLANWLVKVMQSSQPLYKVLTSTKPLSSPKIKYGVGLRKEKLQLSARILDDIAICPTRAYFTLHKDQVKQRAIPDMEDSARREKAFVKRCLEPRMKSLAEGEGLIKLISPIKLEERITLWLSELNASISCKPDLIALVRLQKGGLRGIVFEIADTATSYFLSKKHVIHRMLLYIIATYYNYGVPSVGIYISLSPNSNPPALLIKPCSTHTLEREFRKLGELKDKQGLPNPRCHEFCYHCVYRHLCSFAM